MRLLFVYICFLLSCSNENGKSLKNEQDDVAKLTIYNKTPNKYLSDTTVIVDEKVIEEFISLYDSKHSSGMYNVKNNFGYFQVDAILKDRKPFSIDIVYTVYDGVVIVKDNNFFKQDKFIGFIIKYSKKVKPKE